MTLFAGIPVKQARSRETYSTISLNERRVRRRMRGMLVYTVPIGILVAILAWMAGTYIRLNYLRKIAGSAWEHWTRITRARNECLMEFIVYFSGYLPQGDIRPRRLRRLTDDSNRVVDMLPGPPANDELHHLSVSETQLRRILAGAVQLMADSSEMQSDDMLITLSGRVSLSLFEQDEVTREYNRCVAVYNNAVEAPGVPWMAELFGFSLMDKIN